MKKVYNDIESIHSPIGHYSHAVELPNGQIFLSGQKAWDVETGQLIGNDIATQTHYIFDIIENMLSALSLSVSNIVMIKCFLANESDYAAFNDVYAERLQDHMPARMVIAGNTLRGRALVELVIEAFRE